MKTKLKQTSWINRFIMVSLLLISLTNPWSVGYIGNAIEIALVYFTLYANYVFVVGLGVLALTNIYMMYASRSKVNIPAKDAKTSKAGTFKATPIK